ncbi:hypothetical protein B5M09_011800 [Aphanomyces astaci]|uniref:Uncharacterized protein n=1 Tax=Aphanomyces astaci TaxID=112090 RepID=A0A425C0F7_APHAT|nr:hypothetical protein B5M09_011800 [Aphanomyces astaci]
MQFLAQTMYARQVDFITQATTVLVHIARSDLDSRECQRQLAAFDVRLAAAEIAAASSTQHLQPNDTASASVPVTATPLPAVASTASLASSASKASVGGSNNNNNADGKQQLGGAASSKGSLLPHSKSDASVADSSKGSSSSPSDADDNDSPHVYLRCTLPDRHSDIDACSLDWCAELHDIVVATESTTTPSIDRAFVCKMVHNLRLTKLAINHIDAAFARDCMHLERLDICDNVLRSLDHLPPSLLEVDAYRNQLQTVHLSSSSPTPHLVHVGLGLNMLTSLPTLSHPHTLLSLDLSYNHVTDFAHVLSGLNVFSGLRHVFFTGNPVVLCRGYRHALLAGHPNLYVLDDITVSDKEKDVLLQSPAILADNGADLTVYVTAVGFPLRKPQSDATAPSITYEATLDVLPGQWSVTMKEEGSMKQPDQPSDDDDDDDAASTDKQLRERNMALRDALLEKNRRIQFLETKCGDLFVHRHAIDARLQAVLNQWTILLKTLHTLLPSTSRLFPLRLHVAYSKRSNALDASSKDIVNDIKTSLGFIAPPTSSTSLPRGIQCEIDAWFLTGTEPAAPPSSPDNDAIHGALTSELDLVTSWVHTLLDNTIAPDDLTKAAIDAKLAAERQVLAYQDKLQTYKLQVHELKSDLNKKELERHSACRRLDRAATHNQMTISSSKKALDNKSKEDIAAHMSDKWGKKLVKLSADNAKLKTKLDDAALKNAELRQRVTTYAAYKDQVSEMKSLVSSLETELTGTKERLDMANAKQQQRKLETTDAQELVEAHESEINALVAEVEAVAKETDGLRAQLAKSMAKMTAKDATISKLHAAVAKAEQANALSFDELAGVRLQVAALTTLQRNQKTLEASLQVRVVAGERERGESDEGE